VTESVALYCRVSSEEQDLVGQERELRKEAERRGWPVESVYAEKVSATGRLPRIEYDRLLSEASSPSRRWDHILVWSLDRFSRAETFTQATQAILDIERQGVRFHSLNEPTLDTPDDGRPNLGRDVLLALLPVISSFESKRRSERTRLAMSEIKSGRRTTRSGQPPGRPRRVTKGAVEKAEALHRKGLSWSQVARNVGLPAATLRSAAFKARNGLRTYPVALPSSVAVPNREVPNGPKSERGTSGE
jgi:DNA invertase Pin-like site-specific DNA recombinase